MLPESDGSHIICFVACEVTIYSISIDDITIKVCFLLFQLIVHFSIKRHNIMWIYSHTHIANPICITISKQLCVSKNNIMIPNIWTLVLVNIPIGMHLAHIVSINSLAIINFPFGMHLAFHVHIGTLVMAYVSFQRCLTLAIAYIFIKMCLALHVLFETLVMA